MKTTLKLAATVLLISGGAAAVVRNGGGGSADNAQRYRHEPRKTIYGAPTPITVAGITIGGVGLVTWIGGRRKRR
jgi:hypothetical protein